MIVDRELDFIPVREVAPSHKAAFDWKPYFLSAAVMLLLLAVALVLQIASGAYKSEFNGYPDESAHYVTSLMVREYITAPNPGAPISFAQNYYAHYPKVAFGHWPPLLYVLQGIWMALFSPSRESILFELALTTAVLAFTVYSQARRWFGFAASLVAGLLTICIPLVQIYTAEEMSETLLTLTCLWSTIFFARYLETERWQDNCLFGIFFALAVLTKGSGWLVALVPPIALLLTHKLRLLMRPAFWIAAAIVTATCIPWQVMTMHLVEEGWEGGSSPSVGYTVRALAEFLRVMVQIVGPAVAVLAALGVLVQVVLPAFKRAIAASPAAFFSLIVADWLFHSLVPAGVEDRKLIIAVPALILFAISGGVWLAYRLPAPASLRPWRPALVLLLAGLLFSFRTFAIPHEQHFGFIEAARYITSRPDLRNKTVLVSSEAGGEGPFVAEVAMCEPVPSGTVLRATKVLANVSFDGDVRQNLFTDPTGVLNFLHQKHIQLLVVDTFQQLDHFPHNKLLWQLIRDGKSMQRVATFPNGSRKFPGAVELYRVK